MPWKRGQMRRVLRQLVPAMVLAIAVLGLVWSIQSGRSMMGPVGLALGTWLVVGSVLDIWSRTGVRGDVASRAARLWRLPRADWGKSTAHAGLGVTIAGIAGLLAWEAEDIRVLNVGESFGLAGYTITLQDVQRSEGPNYIATIADMRLSKNGSTINVLQPEKRYYPVADMPTTEAAIDNGFFRDVYVVIGDPQDDGGWAVRTYYKPLANWVWGGAILMALGGALSMSDRRYRVAAGARKAPPAGVPAE